MGQRRDRGQGAGEQGAGRRGKGDKGDKGDKEDKEDKGELLNKSLLSPLPPAPCPLPLRPSAPRPPPLQSGVCKKTVKSVTRSNCVRVK
ncbi:hypothetical protein FBB35_20275 [Nostoc sp. TCL240-02]|nr:hypothetical protein FBB35_20275 [Nostoc sp. TCL240-02]